MWLTFSRVFGYSFFSLLEYSMWQWKVLKKIWFFFLMEKMRKNHKISVILPSKIKTKLPVRIIKNTFLECGFISLWHLKFSLLVSKGLAPSAPPDFVPVLKQSVCYVVMAVIINEKNEILVMQEAKSSCAGQWYLPAGRVEPNESIMVCLICFLIKCPNFIFLKCIDLAFSL